MKATYIDSYKKMSTKTNTLITVFMYGLSGTESELATYESINEERGQPTRVHETTGKMIYFSTTYYGNNTEVSISPNRKVYVANNKVDQMQSQLNLVTDPAVKQALANAIAQQMLANIMGNATPSAQAVAQPALAPSEETNAEAELVEGEDQADLTN